MFVAGIAAGMLGIGAGAFKSYRTRKNPQTPRKSVQRHKQLCNWHDGVGGGQCLFVFGIVEFDVDGADGGGCNGGGFSGWKTA